MSTRKKRRSSSAYMKRLVALLDHYEDTTGDKSGDLIAAAKWLHDAGMLDPPKYDPIKAMAKMLAVASRQDYLIDDNGDPVRHRHCYISGTDGKQATFKWFKIEDATPEKMKLSINYRRNGTLLDILQLVRDVNHYNKHYNPGDEIIVDANFQPDVDELGLPDEYSDEPDEDHADDS